MPSPDFEFHIGATDPMEPKLAHAGFLAALRDEQASAVAESLQDRDALREEIWKRYGPAIEELYFLRDNVAEAANWAARKIDESLEQTPGDQAFYQFHLVQRGLLARSLLSLGETIAMIEAGHSAGALARLRTMYEVLIVSIVMAIYGHPDAEHPDLPERYLMHREAFYGLFAADYLGAGLGDPDDPLFDDDDLGRLAVMRSDLVTRFGKDFARGWGWAAPLFYGKPASMTGLVQRVAPQLAILYSMMSAPTHAGSDGWHNLITEDGLGSREFKAYPDSGSLGAPIELSTGFVLLTAETVVPRSIKFEDAPPDQTGEAFLTAIADSRRRVSEHLSSVPDDPP